MISVIVPVYNTAPYLRQCIDALLGQTYRDIEIVLINDGSIDESGSICDEYAQKDARIIVIHQNNQGVSSARNAALKIIRGDWVAFIDSDDWVERIMFERMLEIAEKTRADIVACDLYDESEQSTTYRNYWNVANRETELIFEGDERLLYGLAYSPVLWNKLIKVDLLQGIQFSVSCRYGEDTLFLSDAIIRAKRIVCLGQPLYHYRFMREGNVVSASFNERLFELIFSYDKVCEKLSNFNSKVSIGQLVYSASLQVISKLPVNKCAKKYYSELKKFIKKYRKQLNMLQPNYRVTYGRLMLVKISSIVPEISVILWNIKTKFKK